jgi:hypothetical protein
MFDSNSVFQRCRNQRCKGWLKQPVGNSRNAFCCAPCEVGFYRFHCRVCERPFEAKNSRKELCGRDKCANEFLRNKARFCSAWYLDPTLTAKAEKSSAKSTLKTGIKSDRAWHIVAGPELSSSAFHCATLEAKEVLRQNTTNNRRFWNTAALIGPNDLPVNVAGGYKFPGAPVIDLAPVPKAMPVPVPTPNPYIAQIPADLSIPYPIITATPAIRGSTNGAGVAR